MDGLGGPVWLGGWCGMGGIDGMGWDGVDGMDGTGPMRWD